MRKHRIEREYATAAADAGIASHPGSLWDDLTKPNRMWLQSFPITPTRTV